MKRSEGISLVTRLPKTGMQSKRRKLKEYLFIQQLVNSSTLPQQKQILNQNEQHSNNLQPFPWRRNCWPIFFGGGGEFRIILQLNQVHTYSVPCKDPETIDLLLLIYFVI